MATSHGPGPGPGPALALRTRPALAGLVVEVAGDLDLDTAPLLAAELRRALTARPTPAMLAVDLSAVGFCDSAALNILLLIRREALHEGTVLHLARPSRQVQHLLEVTGTAQVFEVTADIPSAAVPQARTG